MSRGLRLSLLLLVAGCAAPALIVPEADWVTVPAPLRTTVDRQFEADLKAAHAEVAAATASLAELQRAAPPPAAAATKPAAPARPATGDAWAVTLQSHDRARSAALAQIDAAGAAKRRADLVWRQRRLEAATDRVNVVTYQRELVRAQTIDRNLLGDDVYETAPLRGQFSHAQQKWYAASNAAEQARTDLERASAGLASAKEAYAQLMRGGPDGSMASDPVAAADPPPPPLTLPGWTVTRADIRRRRGLRHFLDETGAGPQLHASLFQMSIALRAWQPPTPAPEVVAPAPAPSAPPAIATAKPAPPTAPASPAVTIAKPVAVPASPAIATAKPAPASPADAKKPVTVATPAAIVTQPADPKKPAVAATPATSAPADAKKPAVSTTATATAKPVPPTMKAWDNLDAPAPRPTSATAPSIIAPRTNPAAAVASNKPSATPAPGPAVTPAPAKPTAATPAAPTPTKPAASSAPVPASAAKPVDPAR